MPYPSATERRRLERSRISSATPASCACTTAALDHLAGAHPELVADDTLLARLSPVSHAHIKPLGRYRFDNPDTPPSGELRPLRDPDNDDEHGVPTPPQGVNGDKH